MRVNDNRTSMISIDFVHKAHLTYRYNVTKKLHTKVFFFFFCTRATRKLSNKLQVSLFELLQGKWDSQQNS